MRRFLWAVIPSLLLPAPLPAGESELPGGIGGIARDHQREPLAGVQIEVLSPSGDRTTTETDGSGEFLLEGLPPGDGYIILFSAPCFVKVEVSPLEVLPGRVTVQNVHLMLSLHTSTYYVHLSLPPVERGKMNDDIDWIASLLCVPRRPVEEATIETILDWIWGLPPKLAAGNRHALQECLDDTVEPGDPLVAELLDADDPEKQELALWLVLGALQEGTSPPPEILPIVRRLVESGRTTEDVRELCLELLSAVSGGPGES